MDWLFFIIIWYFYVINFLLSQNLSEWLSESKVDNLVFLVFYNTIQQQEVDWTFLG
jgi:hypothetical protein